MLYKSGSKRNVGIYKFCKICTCTAEMMHVYYEKYEVILHRENATGCFYNRVIRFAKEKENKTLIAKDSLLYASSCQKLI